MGKLVQNLVGPTINRIGLVRETWKGQERLKKTCPSGADGPTINGGITAWRRTDLWQWRCPRRWELRRSWEFGRHTGDGKASLMERRRWGLFEFPPSPKVLTMVRCLILKRSWSGLEGGLAAVLKWSWKRSCSGLSSWRCLWCAGTGLVFQKQRKSPAVPAPPLPLLRVGGSDKLGNRKLLNAKSNSILWVILT